MDKICVLLYSKYSNNSKKIIDRLEQSNIDISKTIGLQLLCIDNEQLRNRILKSKQIKIVSVPCLLILLPDGTVEKYEGQDMFNWFDEILHSLQQKNIPQPPPQPTINMFNDGQKENKVINEEPEPNENNVISSEINNNLEYEDEIEFIKELPKQKRKKQPVKKNNKKNKLSVTNIEDINSESEMESEMDSDNNSNDENIDYEIPIKSKKQKIKRPSSTNNISQDSDGSIKPRTIPIRTNAGNYEFSEVVEYEQPEVIVTKSSESSKKGGLMAAALAMQKSREKEDTKVKRPFPGSM